jgi:hypothetical protein
MIFEENSCNCQDSNGNYKKLYISKSDAERMVDIRNYRSSINLSIYKCPYSNGWHLTKNNFY